MDCLLLHVPKFRHPYGPYGEAMFINFMAVGLLSVAESVRRAGYQVQVVHTGLESSLDPGFELAEYLRLHRPKVVGISINWHHQAPDSLDAARLVKEILPEAYLVAGGHTVTCFAEEIMRDFPVFDGVVKGEGERPMAELVRALSSSSGLSDIPNLLWRDGGQVVVNESRWHASPEEIGEFDPANFSLLANGRHYPRMFHLMFPPERRHLNMLLFKRRTSATFVLPSGRGCMRRCAWCSGGGHSTRSLFGREKVALLQPEQMVEAIQKALAHGYTTIATDFRGPSMESFMARLLEVCRMRNVNPRWNLDAWEFPSRDLVDDFNATAGPESTIEFSPDFGSEELRSKYKGYHFSNADLMAQLDYMRGKKVQAGLLFIYGLPALPRHVQEEKALLKRLHKDSAVKRIHFHACELDPMSPMALDPDYYGIIPKVRTFADYVQAHREGFVMGFEHPDRTEADIFAGRCRNACLLGHRGRQKCALIRTATRFPALDPILFAAGSVLWGIGQDKGLAGIFSPGAK